MERANVTYRKIKARAGWIVVRYEGGWDSGRKGFFSAQDADKCIYHSRKGLVKWG